MSLVEETNSHIKIEVEQQPIIKQRAIVCQATTCHRSKDGKRVVKFPWPSDLQPPEAEQLRRARNSGITGMASLFEHHDITSVEEMHKSLTFPSPYQFRRTPLSASTSFSKSQSQVSLSQSFKAFQSLGISQTFNQTLGKRKSINRAPQAVKQLRSDSQTSKLRDEYETKHSTPDKDLGRKNAQVKVYKNHIFSCLVISPARQTIKKFESIHELLVALHNAIKAHQSLLNKAKVLHQDISENNIIITDPKMTGDFTEMLIDLNFAIVDGEQTGERYMTSTPEFMAIDVLWEVKHTYRHDLESFFYVLLWICAHQAWKSKFKCSMRNQPKRNILRN